MATEFFAQKLKKLELQKQQAAPRALTMSTMQLKYKIHSTRTKLQLAQAADADVTPTAAKRPRKPVTWADESVSEQIVGQCTDACVVPSKGEAVSFVDDDGNGRKELGTGSAVDVPVECDGKQVDIVP